MHLEGKGRECHARDSQKWLIRVTSSAGMHLLGQCCETHVFLSVVAWHVMHAQTAAQIARRGTARVAKPSMPPQTTSDVRLAAKGTKRQRATTADLGFSLEAFLQVARVHVGIDMQYSIIGGRSVDGCSLCQSHQVAH